MLSAALRARGWAWVALALPALPGPLAPRPGEGAREAPSVALVARPEGVPPPRIDGRLDDPLWAHATLLGPLVQVEPLEGGPPSEATEVRVAYDADALYIALVCHDREPELIRDSQAKRDANLDPDDRVEVLIDPFLDRRNAFWFQIGAGGSMGDALVTKNGSSFNKQWDGIWLARSRVTARGWEAEMRIPAATLNFDPRATAWGFNLRRFIRRRTEEARWASPFQNVRFFSVADAGTLRGLAGLQQGLGLDLSPFAVAALERDHASDELDEDADLGLDAIWRVSPDVKLSLSLNTDFAETEVDARRVNLTRFPLFFPEKRDFFLEDSGAFFFGYSNGALGSSFALPFFSRRIGLDDDGQEVPLLAAAKLTAQTEDFTLGLLDAQTEASGGFDEANLFAGRYSHNVLERSDVGLIVTGGDPDGEGRAGTLGVDVNLRTASLWGDRNLNASAWAMKSESSGPGGDGGAFSLGLAYPNDEVDLAASFTRVDEDFDPRLGFVQRRGVERWAADLGWRPRLDGGAFRWLEFELQPLVYTDLDGGLQSAEVELQPFGFQLESGDEAGLEVSWNEERLEQDFEIADGVEIPTGDYPFARAGAFLRSSDKRPLSVELSASSGEFYDGERDDQELELAWRASRWLQLAVELERNDVRLPGGDFTVHVGRLELGLYAGPDLSWTQFLQYDDVSEALGLNSRLWWLPRPGSEVFLVLDQGWDGADGSLVPRTTRAALKLGWTLRL